jgi:D-xylose 1-dehydrogenase (NADP+, D-xylono-1,5-lactone-forming)
LTRAAASRAIAAGATPTFGRADAVDQAAAIETVRRAAATGTRVNLPPPTASAHPVTDK